MKTKGSQFTSIKTTLWELIETVNEEVSPGEEPQVPLIVSCILDSSRLFRTDIYDPHFLSH